jgi:hypothetical protein
MLITDRYSGFVWDFYLRTRDAQSIIIGLQWLLTILERQYQIKPEVIECDNELTKSHDIQIFIVVRNAMKLEPCAPNTQSQNGAAERTGETIKHKANAMRDSSKLPAYLWVEIVRTAVYLHNRTPCEMYWWKTPYERFFTFLAYRDGVVAKARKPQQAHLRVFGCKAFAMTRNTHLKKKRLKRFDPRAWIGYLVGYNSTNIYRVWLPRTNKVIIVRDVIFNERDRFNGDLETLKDDLLSTSYEEFQAFLQKIERVEQGDTTTRTINLFEDEDLSSVSEGMALEDVDSLETESSDLLGTQADSHNAEPTDMSGVDKEAPSYETDHLRTDEWTIPYLTPDSTPPPAALLAATIRDTAPYEVYPSDRVGLQPHSPSPEFSC